jgi:hypothetical protein
VFLVLRVEDEFFKKKNGWEGGGVFLVMARAILESLSIEKHGVESWAFEN